MKKRVISLALVLLTLSLITSTPLTVLGGSTPDESVGDCSPYVTAYRNGSVVQATGGV